MLLYYNFSFSPVAAYCISEKKKEKKRKYAIKMTNKQSHSSHKKIINSSTVKSVIFAKILSFLFRFLSFLVQIQWLCFKSTKNSSSSKSDLKYHHTTSPLSPVSLTKLQLESDSPTEYCDYHICHQTTYTLLFFFLL